MARLLLVHQEPGECRMIMEHLQRNTGVEVESTFTMHEGARIISGKRFDLALIDSILADMSGDRLSKLAANHNMPVLYLSQDSSSSARLRQLGYDCIERPINLRVLISETNRMIAGNGRVPHAVTESVGVMASGMAALQAEITESNRVFDSIMRRLGHKRR